MDFIKLRENLLNNSAGRLLLSFAAFIYGLGVKATLLAYKKGWRKQKAVNSRVVCIGNITAGGTGKTTAVLLCASKLSRAGIRTAVVSRGYKRSQKKIKRKWQKLHRKPLLNGRLPYPGKKTGLFCFEQGKNSKRPGIYFAPVAGQSESLFEQRFF